MCEVCLFCTSLSLLPGVANLKLFAGFDMSHIQTGSLRQLVTIKWINGVSLPEVAYIEHIAHLVSGVCGLPLARDGGQGILRGLYLTPTRKGVWP